MVKKITIENLAAMVKRGFDNIEARMATKDDLNQMATKDDLKALREEMATKVEMEDGFRGVHRRIDLLVEDLSDLPDMREELMDLGKRMNRVERKVGLVK